MHGTQEKRTLICELTDKERNDRGAQLAKEAQDWEATEEEKKEAASSFKKKADGHREQMRRLARIVRTGKEERENVICEWVASPETESWRLIRKDTGEQVTTKPMSKEEREVYARQPTLPGLPPAPSYIAPPPTPPVMQLESKAEIEEAEFEEVIGDPA